MYPVNQQKLVKFNKIINILYTSFKRKLFTHPTSVCQKISCTGVTFLRITASYKTTVVGLYAISVQTFRLLLALQEIKFNQYLQ